MNGMADRLLSLLNRLFIYFLFHIHYLFLVPMFVSGILTLALIILLEPTESVMVLMVTSFLGIFVPIWKYHLQYYKTSLRGPWDIARV